MHPTTLARRRLAPRSDPESSPITGGVMRPTRTVTVVVAVALMAVLAGCGRGQPTTSPSSTAPAPSVTPTPDPLRRADIRAMVDAARLNLTQLGVKKPTSEQTTFSLSVPCRMGLRADYVATHYWSYQNAKVDVVSHSVFGFDPQRGKDVIGQVKKTLTMCKTWIYGETIRMKPVGEFKVSRPKGVDGSLAYCHLGTVIAGKTKGDVVYLCDGLVSRGSLVANVSTVELTLAAAQAELRKAMPLAAAALVKAVPKS
jgi:hypothetical protein